MRQEYLPFRIAFGGGNLAEGSCLRTSLSLELLNNTDSGGLNSDYHSRA